MFASLRDSVLFPAPPATYTESTFQNLGWTTTNANRIRIPYLLFVAIQSLHDGSRTLLIHSHGNACDLGVTHATLSRYAETLGVDVIGYDYPGYGIAGGKPSEQTVNEALESVYKHATVDLGYRAERIIFFGQSIGTGPTCAIVSRLVKSGVKVGGMILQCPYKSIAEIAVDHVGSVGYAIQGSWRNVDAILSITCPVLIVHGERDRLIPVTHSVGLYYACGSDDKHLKTFANADHNNFPEREFLETLAAFVKPIKGKNANIPTFEPETKVQETKCTENGKSAKTSLGRLWNWLTSFVC
jgi:pimeloyl-ACP methyl ester carboxylesterase